MFPSEAIDSTLQPEAWVRTQRKPSYRTAGIGGVLQGNLLDSLVSLALLNPEILHVAFEALSDVRMCVFYLKFQKRGSFI